MDIFANMYCKQYIRLNPKMFIIQLGFTNLILYKLKSATYYWRISQSTIFQDSFLKYYKTNMQ